MRKKLVLIAAAAVLCLSGCSEEKRAGKSTTEKVDEFANDAKDSLGDNVSLPSESVTKAVSDTWIVSGTDEIYVLNEDGTGTKDGSPFTFECGFDDENNITLRIIMDDTEEEALYALSTDITGYGIDLTSLDGGEDLRFLPEDLEFLDLDDGRAAGEVRGGLTGQPRRQHHEARPAGNGREELPPGPEPVLVLGCEFLNIGKLNALYQLNISFQLFIFTWRCVYTCIGCESRYRHHQA